MVSGTDVCFTERKLEWRNYTAAEAQPTTRKVEIIDKMEFASAALNSEDDTFVMHIASFFAIIHLFWEVLIAPIEVKKVTVPTKYLGFADVFSSDSAAELSKYTGIKNLSIDLIKGHQPSDRPIYSLGPVKLETLKTYNKINLANGFIKPSKSPASAPILIVCKKNGSHQLCVDY